MTELEEIGGNGPLEGERPGRGRVMAREDARPRKISRHGEVAGARKGEGAEESRHGRVVGARKSWRVVGII